MYELKYSKYLKYYWNLSAFNVSYISKMAAGALDGMLLVAKQSREERECIYTYIYVTVLRFDIV